VRADPKGTGRSASGRASRWRGVRPSTTRSTAALWGKSLLNALLFFAIFMVALPWGAHELLPSRLPIPQSVGRWAGGLLFVAGVAIWLWCLDVFSRHGRGTPLPLDAPRQLATRGPFAVVRNPIMTAELAVVWAEVLHFASAGILIYASLLSLGAHLMVVRVEEPELRERFGELYDEYCRRVPRWIPRASERRRPGAS
jgi:protein-S-isoprenylcysteine O-methyltransferase Ste14